MSSNTALSLPKGKKVVKPTREPDHTSKRGVPYWWAPEWVRDVNGTIGRIKPIKHGNNSSLHIIAKTGSDSYIQGSIQSEFQEWHEVNEIDYILLGMDYTDISINDWDYEDVK